ncbi:MAG: hypothetical protein OXQ93_07960 [Gemmatimonadota bacterium]|nr:hypothetical protein [Gemmatimonadota bacterium]
MKGEDLPAGDHVVRFVKPSMILEDGTPDGSDFRLRPHRPDEKGLSVNWLEAFEPPKTQQLSEVRRVFRLSVRRNGRFAELDVGETLRAVSEELTTLRMIHDELEAADGFDTDPSHAQIVGLPPGDSDEAALVGDLIAECVVDMHPAIVEDSG